MYRIHTEKPIECYDTLYTVQYEPPTHTIFILNHFNEPGEITVICDTGYDNNIEMAFHNEMNGKPIQRYDRTIEILEVGTARHPPDCRSYFFVIY